LSLVRRRRDCNPAAAKPERSGASYHRYNRRRVCCPARGRNIQTASAWTVCPAHPWEARWRRVVSRLRYCGSISCSTEASAIVANGVPVARLCGRRTIGVGLRHQICRDAVRSLSALLHADIIGGLWRNRILLRQAVIVPGFPSMSTIPWTECSKSSALDLRLIDAKRVVEAAVLADQNDNVFDRALGFHGRRGSSKPRCTCG